MHHLLEKQEKNYMGNRIAYIQDTPKRSFKGDVQIGIGIQIGREEIPRLYIATPDIRICSITKDAGKGRLVQYLLKHIGEPLDRDTLTHISNLRPSTVKDYMIAIRHAFDHSKFYELKYHSTTKRYKLVERVQDVH